MTDLHRCSVAVIGGGPAGLAAALAIARTGLSVGLVAPPSAADERATALLEGSLQFLDQLGVWTELAPKAAPLRSLRIVDAIGRPFRAADLLFSSRELGLGAFGQMVRNADLSDVLLHAVACEPNIIMFEEAAGEVIPSQTGVRIQAASGTEIFTQLVVGADGRNSVSRSAAGIAVRRWSYPQSALVVNVGHQRPHQDTSTEFHTQEGPFTLAPLRENRSAIVCVVRPQTADRLADLDDQSLARDLTARSHHLLGDLQIVGARAIFPIRGQSALRFAARRIALVGEAAHVLPPIGAQGLNLGLRDAAALAALLQGNRGADPGSGAILDSYDRARRADAGARTSAVDILNRSLVSSLMPVHIARGIGLSLLSRIGPVRREIMRIGMMSAPDDRRRGFLFRERDSASE